MQCISPFFLEFHYSSFILKIPLNFYEFLNGKAFFKSSGKWRLTLVENSEEARLTPATSSALILPLQTFMYNTQWITSMFHDAYFEQRIFGD